ncbi:MAG: methyltransferase type 11 [Candidatus Hydrogenedentota bacterium]
MIYPRKSQYAQDVADHYDDLDHWYQLIWGEHVHHGLWRKGNETVAEATRALTTHLADRVQVQPGDRICDIGCGYGATARILAYEYKARVEGYTLSARQHAYAQQVATQPDNPVIHCRNWFDNGLPDGVADLCISIESSEHMEDKAAFFREVHRVLKSDGRVGVYAWLARPAPAAWEVRLLLEPICREGRLPHMGDEEDYRQLMSGAGFTGIAFEDLSRNVKKTWPIIVGRMARRLTWDLAAWKYLFKGPNREFARTVLRIWAAYNTGSMRYGLFTARKAP